MSSIITNFSLALVDMKIFYLNTFSLTILLGLDALRSPI
jgi:hypothetical protein